MIWGDPRSSTPFHHCCKAISFRPVEDWSQQRIKQTLTETLPCCVFTTLFENVPRAQTNEGHRFARCNPPIPGCFLRVPIYISPRPFWFYWLWSSKAISRCCEHYDLDFDGLPCLFSILKISVKGPKCEWGRLPLAQNLPACFHAAESGHWEDSARMSGSPSHIYPGLQNMWASPWQNP